MSFTSSESPTPIEFFSKLTTMAVVWVCILSIVERFSRAIASIFWCRPMPIEKASIPSQLPHPNPPGSPIPFDIPLLQATDEQIQAFMDFRGISGRYQRFDKTALQQVANSTAEYKGWLYQVRTMNWIDDHFRLRKPKLNYPYVGAHWNGWSSFYLETAPHIREMFHSSITVIFEHSINGLLLPTVYLFTHNNLYFNLALYGEVAYMMYTTALIGVSYVIKRDVTIEQMHEAVWPILLIHHIASMIICVGCILIGENVPKDLICIALLALLGLTSTLHYVGQILDFSPYSQSNAPYTRLYNHVLCLSLQIFFRGIYWIRIVYLSLIHCLETHGTGTAIVLALVLLMFSLFNVDFVKFHVKAAEGCWMKIRQDELRKCGKL